MLGWEWLKSLPVNSETYEITKIDKNMKFKQKCIKCLVFKLFLILWTNYHDICSHLVLVGHRNSLWNTQKQLKYMELITNNTQNANTVPKYAVEAT